MSRPQINIIGSGVLALTCALELAREDEKYTLTIITADPDSISWPSSPTKITKVTQDFVSPWAGAYWQSFVPDRVPQTTTDLRTTGWETVSFHELWRLSASKISGVMVRLSCLRSKRISRRLISFSHLFSSKLIVTNILTKSSQMDNCLGTPTCAQRYVSSSVCEFTVSNS